MKKTERFQFLVQSATDPVVTVDNEAMGIYVRFNKGRVAKTKEICCDESGVITVDLDKNQNVIGIEAIGIGQVTLHRLMQKARVDAPRVDLSQARFGALQEAVA